MSVVANAGPLIALARIDHLTLLPAPVQRSHCASGCIAATLSLEITGTVGILLAAKALGQVQEVTPLLDALLAAGVRLSPRLYDEAQRQAGER